MNVYDPRNLRLAIIISLYTIFLAIIPYVFYFGHRTYQIHLDDGKVSVLTIPGWSKLTKNRYITKICFSIL